MSGKVQCGKHGERESTFVCNHLLGETASSGFNRDEPTTESPYPDAWCDSCELIREAHGGWTEESERLLKVSLLCSGCYERSRIRNTRTSVTLEDLRTFRWKCGTCEEWHKGACLDFGYSAPHYWRSRDGEHVSVPPNCDTETIPNFLSPDYCAIDNQHFFVRGLLPLPILGSLEHLRWGIWGSLSRENFQKLIQMDGDPKRVELPSMFLLAKQ